MYSNKTEIDISIYNIQCRFIQLSLFMVFFLFDIRFIVKVSEEVDHENCLTEEKDEQKLGELTRRTEEWVQLLEQENDELCLKQISANKHHALPLNCLYMT